MEILPLFTPPPGGPFHFPLNLRRSRLEPAAALIYAGRVLDKLKTENDDQTVGVNIVRKAIQAPARQIAENAGEDGSVIVGKVLESKDTNWGFDAQKGVFCDLVKTGIIDPTKVVRIALQNAASVAGLLVTTEAMVAERPEPKGAPMGGGGAPDMGVLVSQHPKIGSPTLTTSGAPNMGVLV